jgi:nitrogen fixation protein FixH
MKISWGTGIALVYGAFAASMLTMVFVSRQYDPGLVDKNYYELDLNFQARIVKEQNASKLAVLPTATPNMEQQTVLFQFPAGMQIAEGTAKFYRAAEVKEDFSVKLSGSTDGKIMVPTVNLHKGRWHVELDWVADGVPYFYTTTFTI